MPKIPSIPRLSIIVPLGTNDAAFEETLVSVLANRPAGCEILVVHDGTYSDPFNISDEVRFVVSDNNTLISLIASGAKAARARFTHILAPGFCAVEDWTDPAMAKFESHDAAVVVPVVCRPENGRIVAAGWGDTSYRLCQPIAEGASTVARQDIASLTGAYLQASFWRREVLQSLVLAFDAPTVGDATYAYGHLVAQAGWRCVLAEESILTTTTKTSEWDKSSYKRGRHYRAIRKAITLRDKTMPLLINLLRGVFRPSSVAETLGQASFRSKMASTKRRLQFDQVVQYVDHSVIPMTTHQSVPQRRAA
ncbi:MAG: glycosyltransferase family 2 protein [Pirellulaceae bacterium]